MKTKEIRLDHSFGLQHLRVVSTMLDNKYVIAHEINILMLAKLDFTIYLYIYSFFLLFFSRKRQCYFVDIMYQLQAVIVRMYIDVGILFNLVDLFLSLILMIKFFAPKNASFHSCKCKTLCQKQRPSVRPSRCSTSAAPFGSDFRNPI